jgi:hypothetical protein
MKSLESLLKNRKKTLKISLDDKDIFYVFSRVIKEEFGHVGTTKFTADFFKNKTLFVKCESGPWASELWLQKDKIVRKINDKLGPGAVERIKTKNS